MWQSISQIRNSNHHYDKSNRVIFEYKNHKNHKESKVREIMRVSDPSEPKHLLV